MENVLQMIENVKKDLRNFVLNDSLSGRSVMVDINQIDILLKNNQTYMMQKKRPT